MVQPGGLRAAVTAAKPGDVLCLADGTYTEAIQPTTDGTAGAPITVRALNDGKATIDGQGQRIPLMHLSQLVGCRGGLCCATGHGGNVRASKVTTTCCGG
jgi:hypothetical protein